MKTTIAIALIAIMLMPMTAFAEKWHIIVVDQCDGRDMTSVYQRNSARKARILYKFFKDRTGIKSVKVKKVK